jgi:hypothetical protein
VDSHICRPGNTIPGLFQVDLRILIPAIRIVSQESLGMPRLKQCPTAYFTAAIREPARNVFSRKVLRLDGLSIVLHNVY